MRVLSGTLTATQAGAAYARLAVALVRFLHAHVLRPLHRRRMAACRAWRRAVLALGKLGGREMTAGSDLDLDRALRVRQGAPGIGRPAPALRRAVFRPPDPAPDQRAHRADQCRQALRRRHAPSALRPLRAAGGVARQLPQLPAHRGLDLGAHGADAGAGDLRPARLRRPRRGDHPRGAGPAARCGGDRRRRGRDAARHRRGEGRGRAVGSQARRGRPGRS